MEDGRFKITTTPLNVFWNLKADHMTEWIFNVDQGTMRGGRIEEILLEMDWEVVDLDVEVAIGSIDSLIDWNLSASPIETAMTQEVVTTKEGTATTTVDRSNPSTHMMDPEGTTITLPLTTTDLTAMIAEMSQMEDTTVNGHAVVLEVGLTEEMATLTINMDRADHVPIADGLRETTNEIDVTSMSQPEIQGVTSMSQPEIQGVTSMSQPEIQGLLDILATKTATPLVKNFLTAEI